MWELELALGCVGSKLWHLIEPIAYVMLDYNGILLSTGVVSFLQKKKKDSFTQCESTFWSDDGYFEIYGYVK